MEDPGMEWIRKMCEENAVKAKEREEREKQEAAEREKRFSRRKYAHLTDPKFWSESDYDTKSKGDHVELYHVKSGVGILEAFSEKEAWDDLREELYGRS